MKIPLYRSNKSEDQFQGPSNLSSSPRLKQDNLRFPEKKNVIDLQTRSNTGCPAAKLCSSGARPQYNPNKEGRRWPGLEIDQS
jgi:hypothetical protein